MPKTTTAIKPPEELRAAFARARRMPQMLEVRDQVRLALRATSDAMDDDGDEGQSDAELTALWTQLRALLEEIDGRISRAATIADLERRAAGDPLGGSGDATWDRQQAEFSIVRAVAAAIGISGVDAGRERETSAELARRSERSFGGIPVPVRALSVNQAMASVLGRRSIERRVITTELPAGGPGGSLIGTFLDPTQYIDVLRPAMVVRGLGARVLSDMRSNVDLPRLSGATTYGWFAENSAIPTSDETFDRVQLRPRHAGAILTVSRNMLQQSTPDIEAIIRDDLAQVLARAVDSAAIMGPAGSAVQPTGIIYNPDVLTLLTAEPSYDGLVDLTSLISTQNALQGSLGWVANMGTRGALLKLKDQYGRPYGLEILGQGYPFGFSNLARDATNSNPLVFGNWNDLILAFWSEIDLLVNPYADSAFSTGNVQLRGAMTLDVELRHPESFSWMQLTVPALPTLRRDVRIMNAQASSRPPAK
jgi:HK97 family phage major capsid protein